MREADLVAEVVEEELAVVVEDEIAADVVAEAPGEGRLAALRGRSRSSEEGTVVGGAAAGEVARERLPLANETGLVL